MSNTLQQNYQNIAKDLLVELKNARQSGDQAKILGLEAEINELYNRNQNL